MTFMPHRNPKMRRCAKCQCDLLNQWWIQIVNNVYCHRHYQYFRNRYKKDLRLKLKIV